MLEHQIEGKSSILAFVIDWFQVYYQTVEITVLVLYDNIKVIEILKVNEIEWKEFFEETK